jgi:hypothetical protein
MLKNAMALAALMLGMLGLLACPTNVPLSDFNTSCVHDTDCVLVFVGDACGCDCGVNAAINVAEQGAYESEFAARRNHCQSKSFCECVFLADAGSPSAVCVQGQCAFEP